MTNHKKSLATRIWIIVLLAVLLSTGSFCVASLILANNAINKSTRQRMLDLSNCAAGSVDGDTLRRLNDDSVLNPGYRRVYNALAIFRDNIEADSVYGIREEEDGSFIITVDPSLEDAGKFGDPVVKTDALVKASKGTSSVDDKPYTDKWGTFYSAYSPVYDSGKEIVGIVGVDFSKEWYEGQQREQFMGTITLFLIVICFAFVVIGSVCFIQIRAITKPMKRITHVAERYQQGDYSERLEIDSEDEIGLLSHTLQSMATSLTERIKEANAANRAKSTFLANMSHEIRTPINAVLGMNEMILRESSDPAIHVYAENVKNAGSTLLSIINDILDFSKIEAGKMEIIPEEYDLSSVINDLVNMVRVRADEKGLELILDFDENIPKQLYGDSVRIKQIITNILTNAVKYTEKGSIAFHIGFSKISGDSENIILNVTVEDTGRGIKKEDIEKLFSKFERIEEMKNKNIEGTGLGMNITKNLLEMMGSTLEVESVYGEGSTFHFALKQKVVGDEVLGDYEASYKAYVRKTDEYKVKFTAPETTILVVDDTEINIMVFENLIKQTLIKVDTAESGDEALELMRKKKYDIIFLDHMMPEKDGVMTLQEMRSEKNNPNLKTPMICLTANAITGAKEEYLAAGFFDYLSKPIDPDRLELMLMKYLPKDLVKKTDESGAEKDVQGAESKGINGAGEVNKAIGSNETGKTAETNGVSDARETAKTSETNGDAEDNAASEATKADEAKGDKGVSKADATDFDTADNATTEAKATNETKRTREPKNPKKVIEALDQNMIDVKAGIETNGTQDSYLEMIEAFYDLADEKGSELGSLYDEKDFDNYLFKIDEIKSSVRIIGATKLGEEARLLENAAKNKDFDYICNKHEEFMRKYDELKEMLGAII